MNNIFGSPEFGMVLTICVYYLSKKVYDRTKNILFYPLLIAPLVIIVLLLATKISFEDYNRGAGMLSYLLGPVTVALAIPLYRQQKYLARYFLPIVTGVLIGSSVSILFIFYFSKYLGLNQELIISLLPKSVTAPIAKDLSADFGGFPVITVPVTILTGIIGPIISLVVFRLFRIKSKVAQGISLGMASHGGGTAKALGLGEIQGAMSGLAMGLAGITTALLFPILLKWLGLV